MSAGRRRRWLRRLGIAIGVLLALLALLAGYLFLAPVGVAETSGAPRPAATFDAAMSRFAEVEARETAKGDLLAECRSRVLSDGARTAQSIVLLHGYTNCPQQFQRLGEQLQAAGFNVYIPLMPEHGEADREHTSLDRLKTEELIAWANESTDIATGLGDRVTVVGLSGGGTVASYLGQFREDVDRAITMAPFLAPPWSPEWLTPALVNLFGLLPPLSIGDSAASASGSGVFAPYAYFDNNTKAAQAYVRLGVIVREAADREPHAAGQTLVVVNEAEDQVSNPMAESLHGRWEQLAPDASGVYRFPASLGLPHDLIGPDRVDQQVDVVYPVLMDLIGPG
jgi:alpha-beta hydrolase superfamily lysophospholipase